MLTAGDMRRRWFGFTSLFLAGGMLIAGQTVLEPRLTRVAFLIYWMTCFLLVVAAILTALLDVRAMRNRTRREQTDLMEQALDEIKRQAGRPK